MLMLGTRLGRVKVVTLDRAAFSLHTKCSDISLVTTCPSINDTCRYVEFYCSLELTLTVIIICSEVFFVFLIFLFFTFMVYINHEGIFTMKIPDLWYSS